VGPYGPTIFYYLCVTDMWDPWFLSSCHVSHVNDTLDKNQIKRSHVGATSAKTGHNTTEGSNLNGFVS
jgi:hypothetical protein